MGDLFVTVSWGLLVIVCAFIVLDYLSGLVKAAKEHEVKSGVMWIGLFKKMAYFMALALCLLLESAAQLLPLPFNVPLFDACCVFIIITETTSILENLTIINPELKSNKFMSIFGVKEEDEAYYFENVKEEGE